MHFSLYIYFYILNINYDYDSALYMKALYCYLSYTVLYNKDMPYFAQSLLHWRALGMFAFLPISIHHDKSLSTGTILFKG